MVDAARDGTNPSSDLHLHLSSERRRGLEEAAKELSHRAFMCHTHDAFGKGRERGLLDAVQYLRSLSPSSEGGEEKTDPILEELARALEGAPILSKYHIRGGFDLETFILHYDEWSAATRAALSKHRGTDHG